MARVIGLGEFEESTEKIKQKQCQGTDVKHHGQVKSVQDTFENQVKALHVCETIEEMGNPFEEESGGLYSWYLIQGISSEMVWFQQFETFTLLERSNMVVLLNSACATQEDSPYLAL